MGFALHKLNEWRLPHVVWHSCHSLPHSAIRYNKLSRLSSGRILSGKLGASYLPHVQYSREHLHAWPDASALNNSPTSSGSDRQSRCVLVAQAATAAWVLVHLLTIPTNSDRGLRSPKGGCWLIILRLTMLENALFECGDCENQWWLPQHQLELRSRNIERPSSSPQWTPHPNASCWQS